MKQSKPTDITAHCFQSNNAEQICPYTQHILHLKCYFLLNPICGINPFNSIIGAAVFDHSIPNFDFPFKHTDDKVSI